MLPGTRLVFTSAAVLVIVPSLPAPLEGLFLTAPQRPPQAFLLAVRVSVSQS